MAEITIADNPAEQRYEARCDGELAGFAQYRLEPGTIVFIHTEVDPAFEGHGVGSRLAAGALDDVRARGLTVVPYQDWLVLDIRTKLLLLFGAVGLLLLIAILNLASLLLARLAARRKEIAMRLALGSGRGRLLGQFLVENLLFHDRTGRFMEATEHALVLFDPSRFPLVYARIKQWLTASS